MRLKLRDNLLLIIACLFASNLIYAAEITDIIQPIKLEAGTPDTFLVSDIFYADEYDLDFKPHPTIRLKYNAASNQLMLTAPENLEGYTSISFTISGVEYQIPVLSVIKPKHKFSYKPEDKPQRRLNVMGNFNSWNRDGVPLLDEDGDGVYTAEIALEPGQYLYQFVLDDREFFDPENPDKVDNGFGGFNSVFTVAPKYNDEIFLHVLNYEQENDILKFNFFFERDDNPVKLNEENLLILLDNSILPNHHLTSKNDKIQIRLNRNDLPGEKVLRLAVTTDGRASNMQTIRLIDGIPIRGSSFHNWQDAVIYSLMVDRFSDGDSTNSMPVVHDSLSAKANYMGGDLAGIISKIEAGYFKRLGVNTLWISPVNQNTNHAFREWPPPHRYFTGYHGYWPTHHQKVEERFGDIALFKKLVETAHSNGLKVLLDFIANHVHQEHPFFQNHRDWFGSYDLPDGRKNMRLWDEFRLTTWFEPFLPSFDYINSQAAVDSMTDNAIWWLKEMDLDGFRHDAVKHVPNNFWRTLTRKIRAQVEDSENRHLLQIGETFGSYDLIKSYVNHGQLSSQFNFNLYDVALSVFIDKDASFQTLAKELEKTISNYGSQNLMGNVMSSHDKIRYMAYIDNDIALNSSDAAEVGWTNPPEVDNPSSYKKALLYYAYMFSIPGIPVVYYGDEFGMTGAADPDNRRMMRFGSELNKHESAMLVETSTLIHLRKEHSALRYGDFQTLSADESTFVFLRSDFHERILIAINKSDAKNEISVNLPNIYQVQSAQDLPGNSVIAIRDGKFDFSIPGLSYRFFLIAK